MPASRFPVWSTAIASFVDMNSVFAWRRISERDDELDIIAVLCENRFSG